MKQQLKELLPALRRFAFSLTGNQADADDLLQSTVEKLLVKGLPADVELLAWAFRVCRNQWIDQYRSQKVRQLAAENPELAGSDAHDSGEMLLNRISLHEVSRAMEQLPDEQREVLSLVAVQGMSYQEAATVLAVPAGTIMSRLARARSKLAEALKLSQWGALA